MLKTLPPVPSLAFLREEAHAVHHAHQQANPDACAVLRCHPRFTRASDAELLAAPVSRTDVQYAMARAYGFPSWPALRAHVLEIRWKLDGEASAGEAEIQEVLCLEYYGARCACHCRHCLLGDYPVPRQVTYARAREIAARFFTWHATLRRHNLSVFFSVYDGRMTPADEVDYLQFRQRHGQLHADYLPINGRPFCSREALADYLALLRDGGVRTINLTFYGLREFHDAFAGRHGDFDFLLQLAEVAQAVGLARAETLFLRRGGAGELTALAQRLDAVPGRVQRAIGPWDYAGRAIVLEAERATLADLEALPAELRQQAPTARLRTEGAWVHTCRQHQLPAKRWRIYFLVIDDATVAAMEREPCDALLRDLREQDARWRAARPTMRELATRYGDPHGQQLYIARDLEHKWLHAYYREQGDTTPLAWLSRTGSRVDVKT